MKVFPYLGVRDHPAIKKRQILIRMAVNTLILMWANAHFLLIYLRIYSDRILFMNGKTL